MTVFSAHCLCSICSSYRWYAWLTKLSIPCFPLALRFVLHSSGIPQTIISIGRNTVCSNAVLLSPQNPLALQKWEWQNISIPWVPWGNAPHGHWSSPATPPPPPSLHSQLLQQVLLVCSIGNGAEVSAWRLCWKLSLRAETGKELGTRLGAVPLCCGKAWRDHSHRVVSGQL